MFAIAIHGGAGTLSRSAWWWPRSRAILRGTFRGGRCRLPAAGAGRTESRRGDRRGACPGRQPAVQRGTWRCPQSGRHGRTRCLAHGWQDIGGRRHSGLRDIRRSHRARPPGDGKSPHVMLVGSGAEELARAQGVDLVLERVLPHAGAPAAARAQPGRRGVTRDELEAFGTVGAVALDSAGNLAAATSSTAAYEQALGTCWYSPIIGVGTYASNRQLRGLGHWRRRILHPHRGGPRHLAQVEYLHIPVAEAVDRVLDGKMKALGGNGASSPSTRAAIVPSSTARECSAACAARWAGTRSRSIVTGGQSGGNRRCRPSYRRLAQVCGAARGNLVGRLGARERGIRATWR